MWCERPPARPCPESAAAHANAGNFLGDDSSPTATVDIPVQVEQVGGWIDSHKLLEEIGEHGFGVVYMTEQKQPVRRKVALKIMKPVMDTKEVIARVEAERQALAMVDPLNISRVSTPVRLKQVDPISSWN